MSKGITLKGFDEKTVINKVAKAIASDPEKVKNKLLSGTPRKIKGGELLAKLQKLEKKLLKLGLDVAIEEHAVASSSNNTKKISKKNNSNKNVRMYKALLWVLGLFTLLILATFIANLWLKSPTPKSIANIEQALYQTDSIALIGAVNVKKLRKLLAVTNNKNILQEKSGELNNTFLLGLLGETSSIFENTDYLTTTFNLSPNQDKSQSLDRSMLTILVGNYDIQKASDVLSKNYTAKALGNDVFQLDKLPPAQAVDDFKKIEFDCPKEADDTTEQPLFAKVSTSNIIFAHSQASIAGFNKRLQAETTSIPKTLSHWQEYRGDKLFAASLLNQELIEQHFFVNDAKKSLIGESDINRLRISGDLAPLQRGVNFNLNLNTANEATTKELVSKLNARLTEIINSDKSTPTLRKLVSRITSTDVEGMNVDVVLDKQLITEAKNLVSEAFSFSIAVSSTPTNNHEKPEVKEKLLDSSWDYALNKALFTNQTIPLDDFDSFHPVFKGRGLSIFIDSLKIEETNTFSSNDEKPKTENLTLKLSTKHISPKTDKNFWSSRDAGVKQAFKVTDLLNGAGESLLIDERCSKEHYFGGKNQQASFDANTNNGVLISSKNLRLLNNTAIKDIALIKGWHKIKAPVDVKKIAIAKDNFQTINLGNNNTFTLKSIEHNEVNYQITGDDIDIIAVHGVNANGQELSSSSSFSMGGTHAKKYQGLVNSVNVYVADKWQQKKVNFEIEQLLPKRVIKKNQFNSNEIKPQKAKQDYLYDAKEWDSRDKVDINTFDEKISKKIQQYFEWQNFSVDSSKENEIGNTKTESAHIFFTHDNKRSWNNTLEGKIILPFVSALSANKNSISLALTLDNKQQLPILLDIDSATQNGEPIGSIRESGIAFDTVSMNVNLPTGEKDTANDKKISQINGEITFRLPTILEKREIKVGTVGEKLAVAENIDITFKGYDFDFGAQMSFEITDDSNQVIDAALIAKDGKRYTMKGFKPNGSIILINFPIFPTESIHAIELTLAKQMKKYTETFSLKPKYKN